MPQNTILHPGASQNEATGKNVRTRSKFELRPDLYTCSRFGEYHPHFVFEGVPGDKISLRSSHNIRSYTLKSPLMADINLKQDYFAVPMRCLLPLNWEKLYINPNQGDDIDASKVGLSVPNFWTLLGSVFSSTIENVFQQSTSVTSSSFLSAVFSCLVVGEYFYSAGSLMNQLGYSGFQFFSFVSKDSNGNKNVYWNFDQWFDSVIAILRQHVSYLSYSDGQQTISVNVGDGMENNANNISLRDFLEIIRDEPSLIYKISDASISSVSAILTEIKNLGYNKSINDFRIATSAAPVSLARLWSYQIVCHHFYSNDHVDYIYSADLFRQLIWSYICDILIDAEGIVPEASQVFFYNGVLTRYDVLSSVFFVDILNYLISGDSSFDVISSYLASIFSFRHSLKYMDYFTGARTQPLAVGDVNVAVGNNQVSVVDVTRKLQLQRFLNSVSRTGRKVYEYFENLFGVVPEKDMHDPSFLGHISDVVFSSEIENTAEAQVTDPVSVTSVLRSNGSKFAFEFDINEPTIIIGISYYDIRRAYSKWIDRCLFHVDRFDMFNPYMQFVGDQKVYIEEFNAGVRDWDSPFAYQLRHAEYKQKLPLASGGFINGRLPSWIFLADDADPYTNGVVPSSIGPSFIRSKNSELDKYYLSLTGWSLGHYWHFINVYNNFVEASRPMVYAPSIL